MYITNKIQITREPNESILRAHECTLRSAHARVMRSERNIMHTLLAHILSIFNPDWLQHARSVRGVYEYPIVHLHL